MSGETIAVASYDRTVKLYSTTNLQLLNTFKGHGLSADRVAFSPIVETDQMSTNSSLIPPVRSVSYKTDLGT